MTIQIELNRLKANIANAYTAINNKGASLPENQSLTNLSGSIIDVPQTGNNGVKFGVKTSTFIGDKDINNILQEPNSPNTNAVFSNVKDINGGVLQNRFKNLLTISSISFPNLTQLSYDISCDSMCVGCTNLTKVNLSSLERISGYRALYHAFENSGLTGHVDLSSLKEITSVSGLDYTFAGTHITSVDLSNLTSVTSQWGIASCFRNSDITGVVEFPKLTTLTGTNCMDSTFAECTNLTDIYFPALTIDSFGNTKTQFQNMLYGTSNVKVHFPVQLKDTLLLWSDVQNGFGGTNTVVMFDINAAKVIFNTDISVPTNLSIGNEYLSNCDTYNNFVKHGLVTIHQNNGIAENFSSGNYISLPDTFEPKSGDTWEIRLKIKTPFVLENSYVYFFGSTNSKCSLLLGYYGTNEYAMRIWLSSNGTTWDLISGGSSYYPLSPSTEYFLKLIFNGSAYIYSISTDNENWTDLRIINTSSTIPSDVYNIGATWDRSTSYFKGEFDLSECYIKLNNEIWWQPTGGEQETSLETFSIGNLNYITYFPTSNILDFQTVNNLIENEQRIVNVVEPQEYTTLTVNVYEHQDVDLKFYIDNIEIIPEKVDSSYILNTNNSENKTIEYKITGTSSYPTNTGTIVLTGNNQTETINLKQRNYTTVGSVIVDPNEKATNFSNENYITSTVSNIPNDNWEFIFKASTPSIGYDSSNRCVIELSNNSKFGYIFDMWLWKKFGLYDGTNTYAEGYGCQNHTFWYRYIQNGTTGSQYYLIDDFNNFSLENLPEVTSWTLITENIQNITTMAPDGQILIGKGNTSNSYLNGGTIYLADCCYRSTIDGTIYWSPIM